jgi:hypothetical protein
MTDEVTPAPALATLGELVNAHRAAEGERPIAPHTLYPRRTIADRMAAIVGRDIDGLVKARPYVASFVAFGAALVVGRSIGAMTRQGPRSRRRRRSFSSRW